jgi:SAM-dependent methyltransferase
MNSYGGLHAELYDLVYADKPYVEEAGWIAECLARTAPAAAAPGRLLDVACGTGRHALAFAAAGYRVTGVDYNGALLEQARASASAAGVEAVFVEGDMRTLRLPEAPYDAVTCLFDSIGYPLDDGGVSAALTTLAHHLSPDGAAAIEFLHAPALAAGYSPTRVRRWAFPGGGELLRVSETELDASGRQMTVAYDLVELRPDGTYFRSSERQSNRSFTVDELRDLMSGTGLEPVEFLPAYRAGAVTDDTFHVVALARRG